MEVVGSSSTDRKRDLAGVAGTEGGRRPTGVPATPAPAAAAGESDAASPPDPPDPEVPEKPVRRKFTAEYKLRILQEAELCSGHGARGALLRREGLYSSHLTTWRRQRDEGVLSGLAPKRRGRRPKPKDPLEEENRRLRQENQRLAAQLKQAETIIDVQKKLSEVLGISLPGQSTNENDA